MSPDPCDSHLQQRLTLVLPRTRGRTVWKAGAIFAPAFSAPKRLGDD
jgi:hypothetical protein